MRAIGRRIKVRNVAVWIRHAYFIEQPLQALDGFPRKVLVSYQGVRYVVSSYKRFGQSVEREPRDCGLYRSVPRHVLRLPMDFLP